MDWKTFERHDWQRHRTARVVVWAYDDCHAHALITSPFNNVSTAPCNRRAKLAKLVSEHFVVEVVADIATAESCINLQPHGPVDKSKSVKSSRDYPFARFLFAGDLTCVVLCCIATSRSTCARAYGICAANRLRLGFDLETTADGWNGIAACALAA